MAYCSECGEEVEESDEYCSNCGNALEGEDSGSVSENLLSSDNIRKAGWVGAVLLGAVFLAVFLNSPDTNEGLESSSVDNVPSDNNPADNTQTENSNQDKKDDITTSELVDFVEKSVERNFASQSTFVKSSTKEELEEEGHGCFTGFPTPCTQWFYNMDGDLTGKTTAKVLYFGEDARELEEVYSEQSDWNGVEKRTLTNGEIIYQQYKDWISREDNRFTYFVEVRVPCEDEYWVTVEKTANEEFSSGPFLEVADSVLAKCKE